jgi:transcriptional regulator NrdR family protein
MNVEQLKRELQIQNSKKKVISWDRVQRVVSHRLVDVDSDQEAHRPSDHIIQDIMEPIRVGEQVQPTQMISATGQSWTDCGMPPSLSHMLES